MVARASFRARGKSRLSLAKSGVAAAAFYDLGFDEHQASMLYLILRLSGAATHALEQRQLGWRKFPFIGKHIELSNDPQVTGDKA